MFNNKNDINPIKFKQLAGVLKSVGISDKRYIDEVINGLEPICNELESNCDILLKATQSMIGDAHSNLRRKVNPFSSIEDLAKDEDEFKNVLDGKNFIHITYLATDTLNKLSNAVLENLKNLKPGELYFSNAGFAKKDADFSSFDSIDDIQKLFFEAQLNQPTINKFVSALQNIDEMLSYFKKCVDFIVKDIESYYKLLDHRHSVEGVEIQVNPIVTDIALTIFENIDSHGEIQDGKKPNEISAYSLRKAQILTKVLENKKILNLITKNDEFILFLKERLDTVLNIICETKVIFKNHTDQIKNILDVRGKNESVKKETIESLIYSLDDLDPESIIFRNKTSLLSETEKFNLSFKNETIKTIVGLISVEEDKSGKIIEYVLNRKSELRKFFQDENSFYVCKIGTGNMFSGEAPGGLSVVPGVRPNVSLDEIVGLGVPEVKEFIKTIKSASKWHDLFVATSPSKSADKSNLLLCGPMGSGKTEVLRAIASEKDSIGVFSQGSDFGTAWANESQKNPKRMFEAGLKLQKESGKHVYFLIDEIDSVLNNDKNFSNMNLTLEFQILMDGVVSYPNLSIWGATNSPQRIPMPMIRRFNKIVICCELEQPHRIHLLKQFLNYFPIKGFYDNEWETLAKRLEGATGDIVRKITDEIWRNKMSQFVQNNPTEAEEVVKFLNDGSQFQLSNFTNEKREIFKNKLEKFISVTPDDVDKSITLHLNNIAIRKEIETAVETYKAAKEFLFQLDSGSR